MAGASDIEWTDATWNPIAGCRVVSPGCTNCYAQRMAGRLQAMGLAKYEGTTRKSGRRRVWTGQVNFDTKSLEVPVRWRHPLRIFVNSMSDLFQDGVAEEVIGAVWRVMQEAHWHTFQILTKRPERLIQVVSRLPRLPNVWLGTSVESAEYVERIATLRAVPAVVRFVSFEPLLGPLPVMNLRGIHWAIVGGESGPRARPMAKEWAEAVQVNCQRQGVAFFFKQWGGARKKSAGRTLNGRTWDEYPAPRAH
jgi:protein gp37